MSNNVYSLKSCKKCGSDLVLVKIIYYGSIQIIKNNTDIDRLMRNAAELFGLQHAELKYKTGPTIGNPFDLFGTIEWKCEVKDNELLAIQPTAYEIHQKCSNCGMEELITQ